MRVKSKAARTVGLRAFLLLEIDGAPEGSSLSFRVFRDPVEVPVEVFSEESAESSGLSTCVLAFPVQAMSPAVRIEVRAEAPGREGVFSECSTALSKRRFDFMRALGLAGGKGAELLGRASGQSPAMAGMYEMYFVGCYDDGPERVWRIGVEWLGGADSSPKLLVLDSSFASIEFTEVPFEFQDGLDMHWAKGRRCRAVYSLRFGSAVRDFCILARDPSGKVRQGFFLTDPPACDAFVNESARIMRSVLDEAGLYGGWLDRHKLEMENEVQRAYVGEGASGREVTSFTSVVCDDGTNSLAVLKSLHSLASQTGEMFDVVVLCSEECDIYDALESSRIKVARYGDVPSFGELFSMGVRFGEGDYVGVLSSGDVLDEHAAALLANRVSGCEYGVVFFDEDWEDATGAHISPKLKTRFNRELFYRSNWMGRGAFFARGLIGSGDSVDCGSTLEAAVYGLCLDALEAGLSLVHAPFVLLHKQSIAGEPDGIDVFSKIELRKMEQRLTMHFERRGLPFKGVAAEHDGMLDLKYGGTLKGKVSIVVPTKDHVDVLRECIESIEEATSYIDYEVVLVENNSTEPETFEYYEELASAPGSRVKVVRWEGDFNYSGIVNYGASNSDGEYLLLLNNDTKIISADFMERMISHLARPEIGVVGAKLLFADGLVQHCGMVCGPYGGIAHVNQNFPCGKGGYDSRALLVSEYSSVTGACQMMRREVFEEVGGYDPVFAVGFNDADFCLRVRERGYEVVCDPDVLLNHYEFISRGRETSDSRKQARWEAERDAFSRRWPGVLDGGDPFMTPSFDPNSWYYAFNLGI